MNLNHSPILKQRSEPWPSGPMGGIRLGGILADSATGSAQIATVTALVQLSPPEPMKERSLYISC